MRGRQYQTVRIQNGTRNTPAYAGKTLTLLMRLKTDEKHPRVCGEDYLTR